MKHNMGMIDRLVRGLVGVTFGLLIFSKMVTGVLAIILGLFALALLGTAAVGYCPPYQLLGLNTCKSCEEHRK
jgi:hypothetical protein